MVGFIVDSVSEVIDIPAKDITPPPNLNNSFQNYIKAISKTDSDIKLLLDCEELLKYENFIN